MTHDVTVTRFAACCLVAEEWRIEALLIRYNPCDHTLCQALPSAVVRTFFYLWRRRAACGALLQFSNR
jgi:hypothetical protein